MFESVAAVAGDAMVIDFGDNLTSILLALIAGVPAIIAAFYARNATRKTEEGNAMVNGRMTELLAIARREAFAQGVAKGAGHPVTEGPEGAVQTVTTNSDNPLDTP